MKRALRIDDAFERWFHEARVGLTPTGDERIAWTAGVRWAIRECLGIAQQHHDIIDGQDGEARPNPAMSVTNDIELHFGLVP